MADEKRYYDLKDDATRVEIHVQQADRPLVLTGPYATSNGEEISQLDEHPAVKAITAKDYGAATDFSRLTVAALDDRFGRLDGYPTQGSKDAKVAFANAQTAKDGDH